MLEKIANIICTRDCDDAHTSPPLNFLLCTISITHSQTHTHTHTHTHRWNTCTGPVQFIFSMKPTSSPLPLNYSCISDEEENPDSASIFKPRPVHGGFINSHTSIRPGLVHPQADKHLLCQVSLRGDILVPSWLAVTFLHLGDATELHF